MGHWKKFSEATVLESLKGQDIESILEELIGACVKSHKLGKAAAQEIREAIDHKVGQGATGALGNGVAVPHVKVPAVKATSAIFARKADGVEFDAGDGVPVSLFFFVVGPEDAPETHLEFMRWVATLARNADFRRFAVGCKTKKELLDLLEEMSQAV